MRGDSGVRKRKISKHEQVAHCRKTRIDGEDPATTRNHPQSQRRGIEANSRDRKRQRNQTINGRRDELDQPEEPETRRQDHASLGGERGNEKPVGHPQTQLRRPTQQSPVREETDHRLAERQHRGLLEENPSVGEEHHREGSSSDE